MRIAVIGDIHLFRLKVHPRRLLGKRLLGQSNLWLNRRFRFNHELLTPVIDRVADLKPDLVLLTGDVTTTSLEDEFDDIVNYFQPLAQHAPVMMVPGNHDRYTFRSARGSRMEAAMSSLMPREFPHYQTLGERWHLLALDSAKPQWMLSRGALGGKQLRETERALRRVKEGEGLVVLCHYPTVVPPGTPRSWAHDMADARLLHRLLKRCPVKKLFIHGHVHKPWHWELDGNGAPAMTCLNAGAPCLTSAQYPLGQGFWEIELPGDPQQAVGLIHHVPTHRGHYGTRGPKEPNGALEVNWHVRHVI